MTHPSSPSDPSRPPTARRDEVLAVLKQGRRSQTALRWGLLAAALAAVCAAWLFWQRNAKEPDRVRFQTTPAKVGRLNESVTATGTLNPVDAVELGAEVTGRLVKVTVDVNDEVKEGQVLAEIDPVQLQSRVQEARASLSSALASKTSAEASLAEADLKAQRLKELFGRGLASAQELEAAQATASRAKASLASANAQILVARAGVTSANTSLNKAIIVAPISGVVLARNVEPGQTLTAGFQTPVLFTLGRDLTQLELKVEVDEADIGKVKEGQLATFTVDAYPNREFEAKLVQLHSLPTAVAGVTSSVVTYSAVLTVSNPDLALRPGMTATATITTRTLEDALLVPNVALRFQPPRAGGSGRSFLPFMRGPPPASQSPAADSTFKNAEHVWVEVDRTPKPIAVEVIGTDGIQSAVKPLSANASLASGTPVLVDIVAEPGS